jgi:hypothetical protein
MRVNWLVLSWALTAAWLPLNKQCLYDQAVIVSLNHSGAYSAKLELSADALDHLRAWGSVETFESANPIYSDFNPFAADYVAGVAIYARGIELGLRHECDHGVESRQSFSPWLGLEQTSVYLKLSGSSK